MKRRLLRFFFSACREIDSIRNGFGDAGVDATLPLLLRTCTDVDSLARMQVGVFVSATSALKVDYPISTQQEPGTQAVLP